MEVMGGTKTQHKLSFQLEFAFRQMRELFILSFFFLNKYLQYPEIEQISLILVSMLSLNIVSSTDVSIFYGWWQFSVCLFAFLALLSIWYHIGKRQDDFGQVWLALSILCWSVSGLIEIVPWENFSISLHFKEGFKSICSLLNSLFILLALPWFRYLPKPFTHIIKSKFWPYIIGLPFAFPL